MLAYNKGMTMKEFNFNPYKALKSLLEVTAPHTGNDFLKVICFELKKLFDADLVFISNAINCNPTTKAKILYSTSSETPDSFELQDTPCELVYKDELIIINENVKILFKKESCSSFESYFGIPLHDDSNECIGHISIFSNHKREMPKEAEDIALIFARKVEAETKRALLENENSKLMDTLYSQSITDPLTKVYNKRFFDDKCAQTFSQVKRNVIKATLIFLDLDDFKIINDNYGHETGDTVLYGFASILLQNTREDIDFVCRIGGEEFAIISLDSNIDSASKLSERIMNDTKTFFEKEPYTVTSSIGIAPFEDKCSAWEEVYAQADNQMYTAKKTGKNRVIC